jgi:hypothetical protein
MAQADSNSTTARTFVPSPSIVPDSSHNEGGDPIFAAIEAHKRALGRRNEIIEAICAAEERHKAEERESWHSYEDAAIVLLTTRPTTLAGVIAVMSYVALPECAGPGACETILDGARLSSNREAAAAAEQFPSLSAEALREITGTR